MMSRHGPGAGPWLEIVLTLDKHALKPHDFCLESYMSVGTPLLFSQCLATCDPAERWTSPWTCKYEGGPVLVVQCSNHIILNGHLQ